MGGIKMKRLICICLAILLSFGLFACSIKEHGNLYISAEIMSRKKVDIDSEFEIKTSIGRSIKGYFLTVQFEIQAPGFTITAPDDTVYQDLYQVVYDDFDDHEKFGIRKYENGVTEPKYFENFRFKYSGDESNCKGEIKFVIKVLEFGESLPGHKENGSSLDVLYEIKRGKIYLTQRKKSTYD